MPDQNISLGNVTDPNDTNRIPIMVRDNGDGTYSLAVYDNHSHPELTQIVALLTEIRDQLSASVNVNIVSGGGL